MYSGTPLKQRWSLRNKIGRGGYGEIYLALDLETKEHVAVKMERIDRHKRALVLENSILRRLQDSKHTTKFISSGRNTEYKYLVMELLGSNIWNLKKSQPNARFTLATTIKLSVEMISAIEDLHKIGYIHRDIKPGNFGIRNSRRTKTEEGISQSYCCIFDFGLCHKYLDSDGNVKPGREKAGFRGTARYASIHSHEGMDLGRRDDLLSLFYMIIEMLNGELPWHRIKNQEQIYRSKKENTNKKMCKDLPEEFTVFFEYINGLKFEDEPNYKYLRKLLTESYIKLGFDENTKYDWEINQEDKSQNKKSQKSKLKRKNSRGSKQIISSNFLEDIDKKNEIILPSLSDNNIPQISIKQLQEGDETETSSSTMEVVDSDQEEANGGMESNEFDKIFKMINEDYSSKSATTHTVMKKTSCKCIIC
ncbi:tau-tubulin kinase 1 [Anaeramoeba flamelloides]|uniref:Tau-tubulin kinase 1 n=1 Tax=Anaeramoeba flamelloides TaxID=1746091 RepID=A0ABQ8YU54_9EUKA|nr:tau-tubulin kinase 1 [Anaeramoeba flamelloides]